MRIADNKTDRDWADLKSQLQTAATPQLWNVAYEEFYRVRINTRYLAPIASIQRHELKKGEGFAIVAVFCTLVEFLESCERGINFRFLTRGAALLANEYSQAQAGDLFKAFLQDRTPFNTLVPRHLVDGFYRDVRCGLVHEARTKGGWKISSQKSSGQLVSESPGTLTLFRTAIVPSLEEYFDDYRVRLGAKAETQNAFIRKFDHLCQP